jgi:hypothetical protein
MTELIAGADALAWALNHLPKQTTLNVDVVTRGTLPNGAPRGVHRDSDFAPTGPAPRPVSTAGLPSYFPVNPGSTHVTVNFRGPVIGGSPKEIARALSPHVSSAINSSNRRGTLGAVSARNRHP